MQFSVRMSRKEKWFAGVGAVVVLIVAGLFLAGVILSRRFEPYIRQQAEQYLRERFDADVQIKALRVQMPSLSPVRMLFTQGRGTLAFVEGEGVLSG